MATRVVSSFSLSPSDADAPSPRPSPHRMGRGGRLGASASDRVAMTVEPAGSSLSPSDGERAGVRGRLFGLPTSCLAQTFAVMLVFLPCLAHAHLGVVRLRQTQGPFAITVFTSPEIVRGRATEVSVMVQRRDSNEAILDATVNFVLTPPRGAILDPTDPICSKSSLMTRGTTLQIGPATIPATREQSPNKLLYAASVNFPSAGSWQLETLVRHQADSTNLTCEIPVGLPARRLAGLIPYLALPVLLVALFAVNQWLRCRGALVRRNQ